MHRPQQSDSRRRGLETLEPRLFLDSVGFNSGLAFKPPVHSPFGESTVLASANFNRDRYPDLVSAPRGADFGRVFYGAGDGQFFPPPIDVVLPSGPGVTAVATGDFTGDGVPEAIFANDPADSTFARSTITLLSGPNLLDARSFPVGARPASLAVADFNRDDKLDVLVAHAAPWTPQFSLAPPRYGGGLLLGNGDGTFKPEQLIPTFGPQTHVAVGDVTGDGLVDAVFGGVPPDYVDIVHQTFLFTVIGTHDDSHKVVTYRPFFGDLGGLALGDLNRDRRIDVAAIEWPASGAGSIVPWPGGSAAWALLSKGDGQYSASATVRTLIGNPSGAVVADFDRDGRQDVTVAGSHVLPTADPLPAGAVAVLRGRSGGALQPPALFRTFAQHSGALVATDANIDGRADIVVGHVSGVTALLNASRSPIRADALVTAGSDQSLLSDVIASL
jgi:hypothetical protein